MASRLIHAAAAAALLAGSAAPERVPPTDGRPDRAACQSDLSAAESLVASRPDDLEAGAAYRQAAIGCQQAGRAARFFSRVVEQHRRSLNARLNLGFAYVDMIPPASDLRQALLGRSAIAQFSRAIEIEPTWLGYHTRGTIRLYYPDKFGQAKGAVDDLERALAIVRAGPPRPCYVRTYVTLGDAYYWRVHDLARARRLWEEGAGRFPDDELLRARLESDVKVMREIVREAVNADTRIDTSLRELLVEPSDTDPR